MTESEFMLRRAQEQDLNAVMQVIEAAKQDMAAHGIDQWDDSYPTREDFMRDFREGGLYIAFEGAIPAAVGVLSEERDEEYYHAEWAGEEARSIVLHRFCVNPVLQNRGLGRECLHRFEKTAAMLGYTSLRLDVFTKNPHALRLYARAGYLVRGNAHWRKGEFLLMEKQL